MIALLERRWAPPVLGLAFVAAALLAWAGLDALGGARAGLADAMARARAGASQPAPLLPDGMAQEDADPAGRLRAAALERRLLIERIEPVPPSRDVPAEVAVDITVSGPESDVLAFVQAVETGRPAIRFARWRLARTGRSETAIRLDARAAGYREPR